MNILLDLIFVFWFFGPAGLANIAAFSSGKIPALRKYNYPADFNLKFRGKRLLGSHKTIRGFLAGIIVGIAGVYLEIFLYNNVWFVPQLIHVKYTNVNPLIFGFLLGFGALFGDSLKSFFKRQLGIPPGKSWIPFDQIDYIVGGILFTYFYMPLTIIQYILLILLWVLVHPFVNFIAYLLRLRKEPI